MGGVIKKLIDGNRPTVLVGPCECGAEPEYIYAQRPDVPRGYCDDCWGVFIANWVKDMAALMLSRSSPHRGSVS